MSDWEGIVALTRKSLNDLSFLEATIDALGKMSASLGIPVFHEVGDRRENSSCLRKKEGKKVKKRKKKRKTLK